MSKVRVGRIHIRDGKVNLKIRKIKGKRDLGLLMVSMMSTTISNNLLLKVIQGWLNLEDKINHDKLNARNMEMTITLTNVQRGN